MFYLVCFIKCLGARCLNVYIKDPQLPAQACVIWMHGLGSNSQNMMALAEQLLLTAPVRHVFIDAPVRPVTLNNNQSMRAWYDITGLTISSREDRVGIRESEVRVLEVLAEQNNAGFSNKQIFLAGFSQGGAMALHTGLNRPDPMGGIIVLSAYLPLASERPDVHQLETPVFIAAGTLDKVVPTEWTRGIHSWLLSRGFHDVEIQEYLMEHSVCAKEIRDISLWLNKRISDNLKQDKPG